MCVVTFAQHLPRFIGSSDALTMEIELTPSGADGNYVDERGSTLKA